MSRALIVVVAIVILAAVGFFALRSSSAPEITAVATTTPQTVSVTPTNVNEETAAYKIDVQYPQFAIPSIDTKIKKIVDDTMIEFAGFPANPPDMASPQNELTMRYESPYIGPDVVSVKLIITEYTGGAHPNTIVSGLNFDRASGRQFLQDDAFKMIGMTVQQVSTAATAQLKQKIGDSIFEEGSNTNPENFSSFVITPDKVTFIFQPYQVAAYAAGPQEVSFPRK